jgi:hypothetical protein
MVTNRTILLVKGNNLAGLGMNVIQPGLVVLGNYNPGSFPARRGEIHETIEKARLAFDAATRTSEDRGWTIFYDGPPLKDSPDLR